MIQQILLLWALFALGMAITAPMLAKSDYRIIAPFLSLFVGSGVYAFILVIAIVGQTLVGWSFNATFALSLAASVLLIVALALDNLETWKRFTAHDYIAAGFNLALILVAAIFATRFNYTTTSNDSFRYLELGESLTVMGLRTDPMMLPSWLMAQRPIFYSLFHALSRPMGVDYLWAFIPVYGIVFIPAFFMLIGLAVKTMTDSRLSEWLIAAAAVLPLFSAPFMIVQMYFINNHLFAAIHYALFFLLGWLAVRRDIPALGYIAVIILLPTIFMRPENFLLVPAFVVMFAACYNSGAFIRNILLISGLALLIKSLVFFNALPAHTDAFMNSKSMLMTSVIAVCMMISGLLVERLGAAARLWDKHRESLPHLLAGISAITVAALFLFRFEYAGMSALTALWHILDVGMWGLFWWAVILVVVILAVIIRPPRPAQGDFIIAGIFIFLMMMIASTYFRGFPFIVEAGPSGVANRMVVQVAPAIVAYLVLTCANYFFAGESESLDA